ncbi:hypothetical protein P3X46_016750 [Hevea brasiliensis]|uniref:DUF4378 domain-containing protein n=1 Tax=Hevea brasiliensis TaxID=3981 RepID=A0ABQ9M3Z2_HEVBR|nr:uncharacterized protein LOC110658959 [Hevea brasiliensis]XP_058009667.1 uncharacterized protein LOC110658959 [Hevea brasiliensis]KAJ9173634.1 hypothetical protein P3X46_016750 [Hevea brasiliensis]
MGKGSPKSHMLKSPMSKSSVLRSPMPKSPMPKSPIPKSPVAYEKYKSRCAYGLMSCFRFRHGHSKKLISDIHRRSLNRDALGDGYIENSLEFHSDQHSHDGVNDKSMMLDSGCAKEEKFKGGDVSIEQQIKKKIMTADVENVQSNSELVDDLSRKCREAIKTSRTRHRLPIYGCYDVSTVKHRKPTHQNLADSERSSKSLDSALTAEMQLHLHPKNESDCNCKSTNCAQHDQVNEINLQVNMNEATEAFINQKLIDGKHLGGSGIVQQSKHFLDALEILNSNRDLFLKLLQDPNSLLLKHIEDLRDSQAKQQQDKSFTKAELSEQQTRNTKECNQSKEAGDCQPLEKIVVFRRSSESLQNCEDQRISHDTPRIHYGSRNVQHSVKPAFFAFEQMKRKLMRAMGLVRKKQQLMLTDGSSHQKSIHELEGFGQHGKATGVDIIKRKSTDKASSDSGGMTKSSMDVKGKDQMDKVNEFDPVGRDESTSTSGSGHENLHLSNLNHPKRNKHDAFVEPRVCVSEMKIGSANFLRRQKAKSWDGISYVPECDFLSMVSSRRTGEHGFVSPQMRFSSNSNHQIVSLSENNWRDSNEKKSSCSSPLKQNVEALPWAVKQKQPQMYETRPNISYSLFPDDKEHKSIACLSNDLNHTETKYRDSEEISPPEVPSKPDGSHSNGIRLSTETIDNCEKSESLDFSKEDSPAKNQRSTYSIDDYSSSPLNSQIFREFDTSKDKEAQPSPVSVLDQLFIEEINSPLNNESQPALRSIRPLQNGIEEGCLADHHQSPSDSKINSSTSIKEYGSMFKYISRVLQACQFSWDELAFKCHFSDQLHDQSLFDDRDVWPNHFCGDHRLLFDHVIEVLVDVNQCNLRCSPWLSFIKPRILPARMTGSVAHHVMKYVDWDLLLAPTSQTMEQILVKDLSKSRTWMDIRTDVEDAVSEMVESLWEELVMEFTLE